MKTLTAILLLLTASCGSSGPGPAAAQLFVLNSTAGVLVDVKISEFTDGPVVATLEDVLPGESRLVGTLVDRGYCYEARCAETGCLMFGCGLPPEIRITRLP